MIEYPGQDRIYVKICPICRTTYEDSADVCPRDGMPLLSGVPVPGTLINNKYEIVEEIGRGGMGTVYRARHLVWNEDRALKVLFNANRQAFLAEAQILRLLQHPNIVRVEDTDITEHGRPFLVMEYLKGEDLQTRMTREGVIDPEEALLITADACSGLASAHAAGIIHRDIKPRNLLLAQGRDGYLRIKIIDFGISKVKEEMGLGFTGVLDGTTGYFVGTPDYASPEQAMGLGGKGLDGRSDLYSLGLVLYQMLTARLPFRSDTPMGVLVQRLHSEPVSPQLLRPGLPQSASDVAMVALRRERDDRFKSASEMESACRQAQSAIRHAREEAIRREKAAEEEWLAEDQRRQRRDHRLRRASDSLRWAMRVPLRWIPAKAHLLTVVISRRLMSDAVSESKPSRERIGMSVPPAGGVRRFFRSQRVWVVRIAMLFGLFTILDLGIFTYFYAKYARVIDEKLRAGVFANSAKIFAAPQSVSVGDTTSPIEIAAELRRSGYTESRGNPVGYYQLHPNSIDIFPHADSYFDQEPGILRFTGGKISQIVSLGDNTARGQYQLEPQLIQAIAGSTREKRRMVKFHDIPKILVGAVTSAEDKRFFQHAGFDPVRLIKAAYVDIKEGRKDQDASTLSMQTARMFFLKQDRRWTLKLAEVIITLQLEQKLSKEEIFEYYANQVDLGWRGTFHIIGLGQASEAYLGKELNSITLPEAAEIAGMIQRPGDFDPFRHPERLRDRRNIVLLLMRQNGIINDRDYALAIESPLTVTQSGSTSVEAPYFVDMVGDTLQNKFQDADFQSNGFRVYTTIDMHLQRAAVEAARLGMISVDEQIKKQPRFKGQTPPTPQVALVAIDPHTGEVKALVGGRNYGVSQLNHVAGQTPARVDLQAFVYATALDTAVQGGAKVLTASSIVVDEPTTFYYAGQPGYSAQQLR